MSRFSFLRHTVREIIDLAVKSEILADKKSKIFCKDYLSLARTDTDKQVKTQLLTYLCDNHGLKSERLFTKLSLLVSNQTKEDFSKNFTTIAYDSLDKQLKPDYDTLFKSLSRVQDGVQTVVKLREDLLAEIDSSEYNLSPLSDTTRQSLFINDQHQDNLKMMNSVLKKLLTLWFSTGLLQLHRITWDSPASLVEKIAHLESVHPLRSLNELKIRLGSTRRCYIFTHTSMPNEPLVILHIALTNKLSTNIQTLLKKLENENNVNFDEADATNAIFYSINSCQKGLKNIDLGNSLIKGCVTLLQNEVPTLKHFHTLSPIPGFRAWLNAKLDDMGDFFNELKLFKQNELEVLLKQFGIDPNASDKRVLLKKALKAQIQSDNFREDVFNGQASGDHVNALICTFLTRSCAFYLYNEKQRGYAINSVCNFHVRNGAHIEQLNFGGNLSERGWAISYGLMVNYGYNLANLDKNCLNYLTNKTIPISESMKQLLILE